MPGRTTGSWTSGPTKAPSVDTWGLPVLQRIREEFCRQYDTTQGVSIEELACHWQRLAEDDHRRQGQGRLRPEDNQAIALRVCQALKEIDLKCNGRVDKDEWVHHMQLSQTATATTAAQINSTLRSVLPRHPGVLGDLQHLFELADTANTGWLTFDEVLDVYKRRLWRLRVTSEGVLACDIDFATAVPEQLAGDLMNVMDLDGDGQISYTDFMCYCLGRRKQEVFVHMYDLSNGLSTSLFPWILGQELEGIWHSGVVVFGKEYYFGGELVYDTPGQTAFGKVKKRIHIGRTLWRQDELHAHIVNQMKPLFNRERYDTIYCNCNHFADRICVWLTGNSLPHGVSRQGEDLMRHAATRAVVPFLNRWLRAVNGKSVDGQRDDASPALMDGVQSGLTIEGLVKRGTVVAINPEGCDGHPVLGTVSGPDSPTSVESRKNAADKVKMTSDSQPDSACWVTYFGPPTLSARGSSGKLHRKLMPREHLSIVNLDEVAANGVYNDAMKAIAGSVPASSSNAKRCRGGATAGLDPKSTLIPGSMRADNDDTASDSPRFSENPSEASSSPSSPSLKDLAIDWCLKSSDLKDLAKEHSVRSGLHSPDSHISV